jgi:nucleoid-associated protein YgaU
MLLTFVSYFQFIIKIIKTVDLDYPHHDETSKSSGIHSGEKPIKISDEDEDMLDKIDSGLKDFWEITGDIVSEHTSKAWDSTQGIREKAKGAWDTTGHATKGAIDKTGELLKDGWSKTKEVSSETWHKSDEFFR